MVMLLYRTHNLANYNAIVALLGSEQKANKNLVTRCQINIKWQ